LCSAVGAADARDAAASPRKFFGKNLLDLGKFWQNRAKFGQKGLRFGKI